MTDNQGQFSLELDEDVADGTFSNLVIVNHSDTEFVVDFVNVMPGVPKPKVKSRIILTPQHAKAFARVLNDHLERFEMTNGEIKIKAVNESGMPSNFGPKGEA
ncbi:MAG: DUF3467 domain-containing protein [Flavobacteriaceae bacterium]|jgi:hypothetical protein|nr:DUF3467 domain-containing protein [Flavobacteriaceae bacterium]